MLFNVSGDEWGLEARPSSLPASTLKISVSLLLSCTIVSFKLVILMK